MTEDPKIRRELNSRVAGSLAVVPPLGLLVVAGLVASRHLGYITAMACGAAGGFFVVAVILRLFAYFLIFRPESRLSGQASRDAGP